MGRRWIRRDGLGAWEDCDWVTGLSVVGATIIWIVVVVACHANILVMFGGLDGVYGTRYDICQVKYTGYDPRISGDQGATIFLYLLMKCTGYDPRINGDQEATILIYLLTDMPPRLMGSRSPTQIINYRQRGHMQNIILMVLCVFGFSCLTSGQSGILPVIDFHHFSQKYPVFSLYYFLNNPIGRSGDCV